jgi:hypothetical protein
VFRGTIADLLTWITTNNGASRQIYADFFMSVTAIAWNQWSANNPTLTLESNPMLSGGSPLVEVEEPPPLLPPRSARRAGTEA